MSMSCVIKSLRMELNFVTFERPRTFCDATMKQFDLSSRSGEDLRIAKRELSGDDSERGSIDLIVLGGEEKRGEILLLMSVFSD